MKKLNLKKEAFVGAEVLSRSQLKKILGVMNLIPDQTTIATAEFVKLIFQEINLESVHSLILKVLVVVFILVALFLSITAAVQDYIKYFSI